MQNQPTREQAQRRLEATLECLRPPAETILELVRMLEERAAASERQAA